jgi:predicted RNase H-related nuclease YkuK (DUF458 family)
MELIKKFRKVGGGYVNIIEHTLEIIKQYPNVQVHIGTDSQNISDETIYVVVIAYRYNTRGVHYIYYKERIPRINDMWTRLWKEAELTIETANWFTTNINLPVQLDMDYNEDQFWKSNQLIQAASGWAQSLGYKVNTKPGIQIATKAADYNCR